DANLRAQMLRHMETIPNFNSLDQMPWYPGKTFHGLVRLRT
ncbi:MAG: aldo/keto reductase, partial [Jatrophihabitans sp.]|nr:aldo/keto reductase [Jatrophihabitans sp.]